MNDDEVVANYNKWLREMKERDLSLNLIDRTVFAEMGRKGGKIGGKRCLETMTAEQRSERARKAGKVGGAARAANLSPERRKEIADAAIAARWEKKGKMKQCEYQNNGIRCKNWVTSHDNEVSQCPIHLGVLVPREQALTPAEREERERFNERLAMVKLMDDETLSKHIIQLEALIDRIKLDQQVASHERHRRLKVWQDSPEKLTEAQKHELEKLRGPSKQRVQTADPMEKEIAKLMKQGFTREKAVKLLEMD